MNPKPRWRRRALVALAVLACLAAAGLAVVRAYLTSARSAALLRAEVRRILGADVAIESATIPLLGETAVSGLAIAEPGAAEPYLTASSARIGVSVLGYLLGRGSPSHVRLDRAALTLRFDRDGGLLTRLPTGSGGGEAPDLEVRDGTLTLAQEGRAPFTLRGVTVAARGGKITGVADDPDWGKLSLSGELHSEPAHLALKLAQGHADLRPALLRSVPFVPPAVWEVIEAEGKSPLEVTLGLTAQAPYVRYGVRFDGLRLSLLQPGRPPFRVERATGELAGDAESGLTLTGKLEDSQWGTWEASVALSHAAEEVRVALKTPSATVRPEMLATLPYVPAEVWEQVSVTGKARGDVLVRISTRTDRVKYRVEVGPEKATVGVPSIGLQAQSVSGKAVIEDGLVTLAGVEGEAAGGEMRLSASLDFRGEATAMKFGLAVKGLGLTALPEKWELPRQLDGRITGQADLVVTVAGGKAKVDGTGKGRIDEASVAGFPVKEPIELNLRAEDGRIRLRPKMDPKAAEGMKVNAAAPPPRPLPSPADLAGGAARSAAGLARLAASASRSLLDGISWAEKMTRPGRPDTYLDARLALDDVDLVEMGKRLGMPLPDGFEGKASVDLRVGIPVNNATDVRAYRLEGKLTSRRLLLAGILLEDLRASVAYEKGVARIEELSARLGEGSASGEARAAIAPAGDVALSLDLAGVSVGAFRAFLPDTLRREASGKLWGRVTLAAPWGRAGDVMAYRGWGRLRGVGLGAFRLAAREASADLVLSAGTLAASHVRADILGAEASGEGGLNLKAPYRFTATGRVRGLDVALLPGLPAGLGGGIDLSGTFSGTLSEASGSGKVRAVGLRYLGLRAGALQARWSLAAGQLAMTEVQGEVERGLVTGGAVLGPGGSGKLLLRVAGVDAAALSSKLPGMAALAGSIDANIRAELVAGGADVDVDLASSRLRVGFLPVSRPKARLELRGGKLVYSAEGDILGGKLKSEGKWPPPPMGSSSQPHGRLRVQGVRIERLASRLGLPGGLSGQMSLNLPYRHDGPGGSPVGSGRVEVRDLRQGDTELADRIRAEVRLTRGGLSLRDVSGTVAGGQLRLQASWRFEGRGWFDLALSGAEMSQALGALGLSADAITGAADLRARGEMDGGVNASGTLSLSRGKVLNIPVSEWTVPAGLSYSPETGHGVINIRDSSAQVGGGRARLRADVTFGERLRVEGLVQLIDAGAASLAGLVGEVPGLAKGRLTGRVDFGGSEVRSLDDLNATVSATLRETQAGQMPVLKSLVPLVGPALSSSVFDTGKLQGRLSGGVFRISELSLEGSALQMWVEGTVTTKGRLDLGVVVRSSLSGRASPFLVRTLLRQVPAVGPVPVGLILRIAEAASDRVLYLKVTGGTKSPVVKAEPLRILSDEAGRFLIRLVTP
jgi:hypothetical protein